MSCGNNNTGGANKKSDVIVNVFDKDENLVARVPKRKMSAKKSSKKSGKKSGKKSSKKRVKGGGRRVIRDGVEIELEDGEEPREGDELIVKPEVEDGEEPREGDEPVDGDKPEVEPEVKPVVGDKPGTGPEVKPEDGVELEDGVKPETDPTGGGKSKKSHHIVNTTMMSAQDKRAISKIQDAQKVAEKTSIKGKTSKRELKTALRSIKKSLDNKPVDNFLKRGFSSVSTFFKNAYGKTKKMFGSKSVGGASKSKKTKRKARKIRSTKGGALNFSSYKDAETEIPTEGGSTKLEEDIETNSVSSNE
jgi:hypothetical protein